MSVSDSKNAPCVPLTHANVLAVALPIIIANITTPLIGIVDTAVLGQLGDAHYIGAVAVGAVIFNMIYWAFGFLRMGTTGITAQAEGSGDGDEVAATLVRTLMIAFVCGAALIVLQGPISTVAFTLIKGSAPVESGAQAYFTYRIWGAPAALANYALLGWFIGRGRAGTALLLQLVLNGLNAVLDALFVIVFAWGVTGVAIGTMIAESVAVICGLWLALRMVRQAGASVTRERALNRTALKRIVSVNGDIMMRSLALIFAFTWFTAKSAEADDVTLAANAILIHLANFSAYFLDGFAFCAESFVGRAIGAQRLGRFREAVRMTSLWAALLGITLGVFYWLLGGVIIDALTINPEVRAEARIYLIWAALMPIVSFPCFQLDGIFIGATRGADMRNMAMLSVAIYLARLGCADTDLGQSRPVAVADYSQCLARADAWRPLSPLLCRDHFRRRKASLPFRETLRRHPLHRLADNSHDLAAVVFAKGQRDTQITQAGQGVARIRQINRRVDITPTVEAACEAGRFVSAKPFDLDAAASHIRRQWQASFPNSRRAMRTGSSFPHIPHAVAVGAVSGGQSGSGLAAICRIAGSNAGNSRPAP